MDEIADQFFRAFDDVKGRGPFNFRLGVSGESWRDLPQSAGLARTAVFPVKADQGCAGRGAAVDHARHGLREELHFVMEEEDENYVFWVERRGRGFFIQATPIEIAESVENVIR